MPVIITKKLNFVARRRFLGVEFVFLPEINLISTRIFGEKDETVFFWRIRVDYCYMWIYDGSVFSDSVLLTSQLR